MAILATTKIFKPYNLRNLSSTTIFNLSSGYGKCGVSVIRVSGPLSLLALKSLISVNFEPHPRHAALKTIRHPKTNEMIDKGIVLWFPGPKSFTGEDCCEFQVHGGIAIVEATLDALSSVRGLNVAKPGEFTKRAFFNGKLDLTEVEGLADLIHAETEAQRKQALFQTTGALSKLYRNWRTRIVRNIAHLEAYIDFAEDENIGAAIMEDLRQDLIAVRNEIKYHLNDQRQGEYLRNGVQIVITGAPNVGKSSFINHVCQRKISIVTSIAGTTRDIVESYYNVGGYPAVFTDTAGLRVNVDDIIEQEGIGRALDRIKSADIIIFMIDALKLVHDLKKIEHHDLNSFIHSYLITLGISHAEFRNKSVIIVANKIDLLSECEVEYLHNIDTIVLLSCKTGQYTEVLLDKLKRILQQICGVPSSESPRLSQSRYRHLLIGCCHNLDIFFEIYTIESSPDLAIASQKLRKAVRCIESITGEVTPEEILNVIFRDFCIGK